MIAFTRTPFSLISLILTALLVLSESNVNAQSRRDRSWKVCMYDAETQQPIHDGLIVLSRGNYYMAGGRTTASGCVRIVMLDGLDYTMKISAQGYFPIFGDTTITQEERTSTFYLTPNGEPKYVPSQQPEPTYNREGGSSSSGITREDISRMPSRRITREDIARMPSRTTNASSSDSTTTAKLTAAPLQYNVPDSGHLQAYDECTHLTKQGKWKRCNKRYFRQEKKRARKQRQSSK